MVSLKSSLQRSIKPLQRAETHQRKKKIDVILYVAAALHIFNHVASQLLKQRQPTPPPADKIERSTLLSVIDYVTWAKSQKEIFVEVNIVTI